MVKRKMNELIGSTAEFVGPVIAGAPELLSQLKIGDRLAAARSDRELTQQKLADTIDKSRTTIVQYESGVISPPLAIVEQLAQALHVDPAFLAFGRNPGGASDGERLSVSQDPDRPSANYFEVSAPIAQQLRLTGQIGQVFALPEDAPHFHLRRGDHLFVDVTRDVLQADGKLYAVRSSAGDLSLVRTEVGLGEAGERIRLTLGQGQISEVLAKEVKVVGLVRATLKVE